MIGPMSTPSREILAVEELPASAAHDPPATARLEVREVLLWIVVVAGVFNFSSTLFSTGSVSAEPVWTKAVKDIPSLLLLGVLAYQVIRRGGLGARKDLERITAATAAVAVFMIASALLFASPRAGDVVSAQYYVVYPLIAVGLAAVPLAARQIQRLLVLVVALGVFESVLAVPDALGLFAHTYYSFYAHGTLYNRAIGTLGNPNNLGLFLGLALIVAASNAIRVRPLFRAVALAAILVGLFLTFSKTAALGLGISVFFLTQGTARRRALLTAGAAAIGFCIAFSAVVIRSDFNTSNPPPPPATVAAPSGSTSGSGSPRGAPQGTVRTAVGNRQQTASGAWRRWTSGPKSFLVGSGFATLTDVGSGNRLTETVVDNMVLGLAIEGGLIGLLLVGAVVLLTLVPLFRAGGEQPLVRVARTNAVFFLLYVPVAVNLRLFPVATFFWIFAGLGLGVIGAVAASGRLRARGGP
jgi:hypothetical protein